LADFAGMCRYHQTRRSRTSLRSAFAPLPPEGRVTLTDSRLIITANGRREERELTGREEYEFILLGYFGIEGVSPTLDEPKSRN
jgi:arylamine N-acetyltransferase